MTARIEKLQSSVIVSDQVATRMLIVKSYRELTLWCSVFKCVGDLPIVIIYTVYRLYCVFCSLNFEINYSTQHMTNWPYMSKGQDGL